MKIKVSPSLLSCDYLHLANEVERAFVCGADMLHFDVMDGVFVNNISFGIPILQAVKKVSKLPLDVHLMICRPQDYIERFVQSGADIITFHSETGCNIEETVALIKKCGAKAGIAIKPHTPAKDVQKYIGLVDMILVMTVEPGFGGQAFMPQCLDKIRELRSKADSMGVPLDIQVDGGINADTAKLTVDAGANVIVSGSYLFAADDMTDKIAKIKALQG